MDDMEANPIIIGATGGSGTRALRNVLVEVGVFMGVRVNASDDSLDFVEFLDAFIEPILSKVHSPNYRLEDLPKEFVHTVSEQLLRCVDKYRSDCAPGRPWGWKNPRNLYIFPFIRKILPNFYFIHLMRDGRDMALSNNQNQLRSYNRYLFSGREILSTPEASMRFWSKVNTDFSKTAQHHLGARYILLRFEDLCADPRRVICSLCEQIGITNQVADTNLDKAVASLYVPESCGRWKQLTKQQAYFLTTIGAEGLRQFRYI